jgi:hypothetical protein
VALRNRVIKAATFEGMTPDGLVTDDLIDFHLRVARGGVGMTTVAYLAVAPEGRTDRHQIHLREQALPGLRRLTDSVHEAGAAVAAQIGHAGPVANGRSNGIHALSSYRLPSPLSLQMVRTATEVDLVRVASLYVNGIDPGFANDVLPLVLTSLSQRIDEVRCSEIADYSTYYQPVVMSDIFGFAKPLEDVPMLFQPGILSMAWGSVVRQIAAGLGVRLDEPLVETVERVAWDRNVDTVSCHIAAGTAAAVRFEVAGTVNGVPPSYSSTSPAPIATRCRSGRSPAAVRGAIASRSPGSR